MYKLIEDATTEIKPVSPTDERIGELHWFEQIFKDKLNKGYSKIFESVYGSLFSLRK